jgi:hypothetical protein
MSEVPADSFGEREKHLRMVSLAGHYVCLLPFGKLPLEPVQEQLQNAAQVDRRPGPAVSACVTGRMWGCGGVLYRSRACQHKRPPSRIASLRFGSSATRLVSGGGSLPWQH